MGVIGGVGMALSTLSLCPSDTHAAPIQAQCHDSGSCFLSRSVPLPFRSRVGAGLCPGPCGAGTGADGAGAGAQPVPGYGQGNGRPRSAGPGQGRLYGPLVLVRENQFTGQRYVRWTYSLFHYVKVTCH